MKEMFVSLVFWAKSDGIGKASLGLQNTSTFATELYFNMPIVDSWNQYLIPFQASEDYDPGDFGVLFQVNWMDQILEFGGVAILNYGSSVELEDLPRVLNNEFYGGYEADAPWRTEAEQRIEQLRKADLQIEVVDGSGNPVEGATVQAEMIEHAFGFGTAVAAHLFAGNSQQNNTYEDYLLDLDGEGHRFNCAVFENATKWKAWEENWFGVNKDDKAATLQWLNDREFKVRGHTLIWPSWTNLPDDLFDNQDDPDYIIDRVIDHIEAILSYPGMEGGFSDWDVINELSILQDLADAVQGAPGYPTGREIYLDILEKFYEMEPDGIAYINDYTTFGGGSSPQLYADLKTYLQEIIDAGQTIDGVGFQGHIGTYPTSINELYDIYEDFYTTFGTEAKVTEFDMNALIDDDLAAQYLKDFYTLSFSHPSMNAILMWGFWDGAHWFDNAPMYDEDWSLKPAGEAFLDLVFDEWWTEENGTSDQDGMFNLRGFKGQYEISVGCPNGTWTETIDLTTDSSIEVDCATVSSVSALEEKLNLQIFPNPAHSQLEIQWSDAAPADIYLVDMLGRERVVVPSASSPIQLELDIAPGVYQLIVKLDGAQLVQKVVIN